MNDEIIDADYKIITSCPDCDNQSALYLIKCNRPIDGTEVQWCDSCSKPYIVDVKIEMTCKVEYYRTDKVKQS